MLKTDTGCLQKQKEYKNFIVIILAKLYNHHLKCCNQGYDLLSMKEGGAGIIITGFQKLAGYEEKNLEMLNSAAIIDYINGEQLFRSNKTIQSLSDSITREVNRITKGNL